MAAAWAWATVSRTSSPRSSPNLHAAQPQEPRANRPPLSHTAGRCRAVESRPSFAMGSFLSALFGTRYLPAGVGAPVEAGLEGVETDPTTGWAKEIAPFQAARRREGSVDEA